jgi:hypothetical protein
MMNERSVRELAAAAGRGDREAMAILVERYRPGVYAECLDYLAGGHRPASEKGEEA